MVVLVLVVRLRDKMALTGSIENGSELAEQKSRAKSISRSITEESPNRLSVDDEEYMYHYIVDTGVIYIAAAEKGYPSRLAFAFLDSLKERFYASHGHQIDDASRPYEYIRFAQDITKMLKEYRDPRSQRNLDLIEGELKEVRRVMVKNVQDIIDREEQLANISDMSSQLKSDAAVYADKAKQLATQTAWRQYAPFIAVALVVLFLLILRWFLR
ncbi:Regulated-SNARE-like domain [Carpediemonas membranifera]|uniref:Regulated-SNARE-like domain n=1 Tax=Carpediemonas membranifera TaxID=201153 RepID=A0A8J6E1E8_9EUKA|nr:Regulated-SNARE-like domain [Carpediemonas membranifera]|eukprot:KAG9393383.1 Regulated-SNARE-like domain [Carpediemonas membranifera]